MLKPPACDEVYYFPANGKNCSAYTDSARIERLCSLEKELVARRAFDTLFTSTTSGNTRSSGTTTPPSDAVGSGHLHVNDNPNRTTNDYTRTKQLVNPDIALLVNPIGSSSPWQWLLFFCVGCIVGLFARRKPKIMQIVNATAAVAV